MYAAKRRSHAGVTEHPGDHQQTVHDCAACKETIVYTLTYCKYDNIFRPPVLSCGLSTLSQHDGSAAKVTVPSGRWNCNRNCDGGWKTDEIPAVAVVHVARPSESSRRAGILAGNGKHSASDRRVSPGSPGNRSSRQCRLRQRPGASTARRNACRQWNDHSVWSQSSGAARQASDLLPKPRLKDSRSFKHAKSFYHVIAPFAPCSEFGTRGNYAS